MVAQRPQTVPTKPQNSPPTAPKKINVGGLSLKLALTYYYDKEKFREVINGKTYGGMKGLDWNPKDPTNTCALRVSYALHKIGVDMNGVNARRMLARKVSLSLPSVAEDYENMIEGGVVIKEPEGNTKRTMLNKRQGIILFTGGISDASGHVTFFRDINCYDTNDNKYFDDELYTKTKIIYWLMQP